MMPVTLNPLLKVARRLKPEDRSSLYFNQNEHFDSLLTFTGAIADIH